MYNYQTRLRVKKSLKFSVLDGAAWAAMFGLTQNYITPFALALKATTVQIGLLSSLPNFAMALFPLAAPYLSERAGSRKGLIMPCAFVHAIMWLPVFLLPYFFRDSGVIWLIYLFTISSIAGSLPNPAWGSMMADLVREDVRGRYFSFRGRISTFINLSFSIIGGLLLQIFTNNVFIGFGIIFGGATLFRLLSLYFLSRMYEPPLAHPESNITGLPYMIKNLGSSNLGRFILFLGLIYFAIMISGPFFSVYMLRDLGFSYLTFTIVACSSTVSTIIFLPFWGRRADRAGNIKIIKITCYLLPVIPLLWLVNTNPWYLVAANIFSGFVWSGFELASTNFIYDASNPDNRTRQIAIFNSILGIAMCIGSLAGGYLAPNLPETLGYELRSLFTISGVLRAAIVVILLRTISEVRHVPEVDMFHLLLGRTNPGVKEKVKNKHHRGYRI